MILTKFIFDDYNLEDRDFLKEEVITKLPFRVNEGDRVDMLLQSLDEEKMINVNTYYRKLEGRITGSYVLRAHRIELDFDSETKEPLILVICGF